MCFILGIIAIVEGTTGVQNPTSLPATIDREVLAAQTDALRCSKCYQTLLINFK